MQRQEADKERSEVQELQLSYDSQARQLERTKKEKEALEKLLKEQLLRSNLKKRVHSQSCLPLQSSTLWQRVTT